MTDTQVGRDYHGPGFYEVVYPGGHAVMAVLSRLQLCTPRGTPLYSRWKKLADLTMADGQDMPPVTCMNCGKINPRLKLEWWGVTQNGET